MHTLNVLYMKIHMYLYSYISMYTHILDKFVTEYTSKYKHNLKIYAFWILIFSKELTLQGKSETLHVPYI
jgi:hypothetical protein